MKKILITGGSGFIGTNLVEYYIRKGFEVLNIDIAEPKIKERISIWKQIDICDFDKLYATVMNFSPEYILHMAARTDLDGKTVDSYSANTVGVENILKVSKDIKGLKKMIITSSQHICPTGYYPKDQFDYAPYDNYGRSKVITEKNVWANKPNCDWAIIRPTSIWGPWFGVPYRNFFDMVMAKRYFHIGHRSATKTYGYVGNTVYQIDSILNTETKDEKNKIFYIGDNPPIPIEKWANEIGDELGIKIPRMPYWILKCAAIFGDGFYSITGKRFPMNSLRLRNMTTRNTRNLDKTYAIAPNPPYDRITGVRKTLEWLKKNG